MMLRDDIVSKAREFHLGDLLSIITGLLVSPRGIKGMYEAVNFILGDERPLNEKRRVACRTHLALQFPQLVTPEIDEAVVEITREVESLFGPDAEFETLTRLMRREAIARRVGKLAEAFGEKLRVNPSRTK